MDNFSENRMVFPFMVSVVDVGPELIALFDKCQEVRQKSKDLLKAFAQCPSFANEQALGAVRTEINALLFDMFMTAQGLKKRERAHGSPSG